MILLGACAAPSTPPAETPAPTTTAPTPAPTPAEFEVMSLAVEPSEVVAGKIVSIIAEVKNVGGSEGSYSVVLTIDGAEVETKEVTLAPGATEAVTFRLGKYVPGAYQIGVGGLTSPLRVKEKPVPAPKEARVVFFVHVRGTNEQDRRTIEQLCNELGFSFETRDYRFVNNEAKWFDEEGQRKFDIFIIPGGENWSRFEKTSETGTGIDDRGCQNIRKFIDRGGSCITICASGCAVFAETQEWIGLTLKQAEAGVKWARFVHKWQGVMVKLYGIEPIFKGKVRGPQESNLPYPRVRFLPIRLNMENSLVKDAGLPDTVYLHVAGGASLIPNPDQAMEEIGWFPNGTAAIAMVKYGDGCLYMLAPHPNLTLENSFDYTMWEISGDYPRTWGLSDKDIEEAVSILENEGDADGPDPDLILMKAILKDASDRASALAR